MNPNKFSTHRLHALTLLASMVVGAPAMGNEAAQAQQVERGQYLVTVAACHDCHTPWMNGPEGPAPDMSRMLSGHPQDFPITAPPQLAAGPWISATSVTNTAWAGPWGVSFTANLTPDPETGLGKWNEKTFAQTIRTGRHMGRGRKLLPPMPIPMYRHFTDEDLSAIFAYLQSIPAIKNRVPEPLPPVASAQGAAADAN